MGTKPKPTPLCGNCDGGWIYPDPTDPASALRCPCRRPELSTAEGERDAALVAVAAANAPAFDRGLSILEHMARTQQFVNANNTRHLFDGADIHGPVVGAIFNAAARQGLLTREGYTPSTQPETKGHPVAQWRSLRFHPEFPRAGSDD